MGMFATEYGYFNDDAEYVITRPDTPRPWINVICPGDYGVVVSQTGGGYSWKTHASLNRITRWEQDLVRDDWGKFLYIRDDASGDFWSATWKPTVRRPELFQAVHGIGYSRFTIKYRGILSHLTIFVPPEHPLEIWQVELINDSESHRRLSLFTYLEWCLGAAPDWHREFHKSFIETEFDARTNALWARKRLWELPNEKGQHWNRDWPYHAFHSVSEPVVGFSGDKERFLGAYGSTHMPAALTAGCLANDDGRWDDAIASLHNRVELPPGGTASLCYLLGAVAVEERAKAEQLIVEFKKPDAVQQAFSATNLFWQGLLFTTEVATPDPGFNLMNNIWLKYQAISCHIWGRTAYYQTGGAYGFRDQLQASQIFLTIDPPRAARQIKLHASRQFPEGRVNHWWHPLSEQGIVNNISDNLLWLPFVTVRYLKETGDFAFLEERVPYMTGELSALYEHCCRAIDYSLQRRSPRGLPLIGDGDWNDGLNAVGGDGRGESVWLGHFLHGLLIDFAVVAERVGDTGRAQRYLAEAESVKKAVNLYGWDGEWYARAFCDDGTPIGVRACAEGRIFLNAQTWAILHDTADDRRRETAFAVAERHLFKEYGPLLLAPAYTKPDSRIGYLTRYAPGMRENGGVYVHAACWAVLAACKMGRQRRAFELYKSYLPPYRGMDPELYKAEPYVMPGNVDGPDSPHFGRGGWTWYTGSATWAYLAALEGILGVHADWDGLHIEPSIPDDWDGFSFRRPYRGATYLITCGRSPADHGAELWVDGERVQGLTVKPHGDGAVHEVRILLGKSAG